MRIKKKLKWQIKVGMSGNFIYNWTKNLVVILGSHIKGRNSFCVSSNIFYKDIGLVNLN